MNEAAEPGGQAQAAAAGAPGESGFDLASIAALTANAVVVVDAAGRIEWVNAAFTRLTGYRFDEVCGRAVDATLLGPQTEAEAVAGIGAALQRGDSVSGVELLGCRKDGAPFWILFEAQPLRDAAGKVSHYFATGIEFGAQRAAREQLRVAIESLRDGFVLYDRDDRLVVCNARYREVYRLTDEQTAPGSRFVDVVRVGLARGQYPDAVGREEAWLAERLAHHHAASGVLEQRLDDGRWLRLSEHRTPDGGVVGFRVDITELKQAQESAAAAAQVAAALGAEMNAIFDLSPDGIIAFDAAGRATHTNRALGALTGLGDEELAGVDLARFDRLLAARCESAAALAGSAQAADGAATRFTLAGARPVTLERSVRSLRARDGRPAGLVVYLRDLTESLATERELLAQQAKFKAAFRHAADFMLITRLDDGRIVEANDAFCRAQGRTRAEVLGRTVLELGLWADPERRGEALRLLREHGTLSNFPFRQRHHDGSVRHCLLSASIVAIDGERCVLSTARDVSERVVAEESARELTQRLQVTVAALEELNRQGAVLSEMRDLLQSCQTPDEVNEVAASFMPRLLPGTRGALYRYNAGRTALEASFSWGDRALGEAVFGADECWALRRGRPFHVPDGQHPLRCAHVRHPPPGGTLCLPMMAQGEHFGLLHVAFDGEPQTDPTQFAGRESFLRTMAEHVSLAMSNARLRENLHVQASRDPLTGLLNRRFAEEAFERELSRCRRRARSLAVLMIDVDRFKLFNDRFGHDAGDTVLKRVAEVLAQSLRAEDLVCRYGGEEFLALLPETDERVALECAERARRRMAELAPEFRGQRLGAVTVSIGLALYPEHGATPGELILRADQALYEAKRGGRNRTEVALRP